MRKRIYGSGWEYIPMPNKTADKLPYPRSWKEAKKAYTTALLPGDGVPLPAALPVLKELSKRYGQPRVGWSRATFRIGNGFLLKVPYNTRGWSQNNYELNNWFQLHQFGQGIPTPQMMVADLSQIGITDPGLRPIFCEEVEVLSEDFIQFLGSRGQLPAFADRVDAAQLGRTRAGQIVAYDL